MPKFRFHRDTHRMGCLDDFFYFPYILIVRKFGAVYHNGTKSASDGEHDLLIRPAVVQIQRHARLRVSSLIKSADISQFLNPMASGAV